MFPDPFHSKQIHLGSHEYSCSSSFWSAAAGYTFDFPHNLLRQDADISPDKEIPIGSLNPFPDPDIPTSSEKAGI